MVKQNNRAEIELLDTITKIANRYGMNSRTLLTILSAEVKRMKEAGESHSDLIPEQWFDEAHGKYVDYRSRNILDWSKNPE